MEITTSSEVVSYGAMIPIVKAAILTLKHFEAAAIF